MIAARQRTSTPKSKDIAQFRLWQRPALLSIVLVLATIGLYYPVHRHPFINYDDNKYIYENVRVLSGLNWATVGWAFTSSSAANWHPLTWLTHAAACQLFGNNPAGHHDVNVLFHALDALLLFWVLLRGRGFVGRSFMVAALFALHPINVESVAWIAELKTSLSTAFFLLALGAYGWYGRRPSSSRMAVVSIAFGLGLMAKPQIIALPFVLLLWDYWPLNRWNLPNDGSVEAAQDGPVPGQSWRNLVNEKRPLFVLAAASAMLTLHAQHHARIWYPLSSRLGNAILSYGFYIKKAIWPSELALLYPHPGSSIHWAAVIWSALALSAITLLVIVNRSRRYLVVGWLWFLMTLVPMLGLVQVGVQAMADRYAYISFIGLFIMITWGLAELAGCMQFPRFLLPAASVITLVVLAPIARRQISYWGAEQDLWRHTLQVTDRNWVAESELGAVLAMNGDLNEAVRHFNNALVVNPNDVTSNMGLAIYDLRAGNFPEAIQRYKLVVEQRFLEVAIMEQAYVGLAKSYAAIGKYEQARESIRQARRLSSP